MTSEEIIRSSLPLECWFCYLIGRAEGLGKGV